MSSESENLKGTQALLLMYLTGELSPQDRFDLQRKLDSDPALRARLEELQAAHAAYLGMMQSLDAVTPLPVSEEVAARSAGRLIRQFAAGKLTRPSIAAKPRPAIPWWSYPLATAAGLVIALTVWSLRHYHELYLDQQVVLRDQAQDDDQSITDLQDSVDQGADEADTDQPLAEADRTIAAIRGSDTVDDIFLGLGTSGDSPRGTP